MSESRSQGRITRGLEPGTTVRKTLEFVKSRLPLWRDTPSRIAATAEEELNSQLCKFLNAYARSEFPLAIFHHEERQTGRRRVDISALSPKSTVIEGRNYSIFDPFLVIEGKRLPAPSKDREREYVTGNKQTSGGIQRFRLGLHGSPLNHAGIIAYVQEHSCAEWFSCLNSWINELSERTEEWTIDDCLVGLECDADKRIASCTSVHTREDGETPHIQLTHLWVEMHD